jgi:type I restriction enzyme S subunit
MSAVSSKLVGAVQQHFNVGAAREAIIPVPPLPVQRAIVHILGTLDDKIELNRKMNETLEQMARALFKSWFVDFDPVRAKAAGQKPFRMDEETAKVFPDGFEESELGPIPRGWSVGTLGQVARMEARGVTPMDEPEATWEHYSIPAYDASGRPALDIGASIKSNKYFVPSNAVLLSKLNPATPRVWLVSVKDLKRAVCSTELLPLLPRLPESRSFLYGLLTSTAFSAAVEERASGSTGSRQRALPGVVLDIKLPLPRLSEIRPFEHAASALLGIRQSNIEHSEALYRLRDTLLPRLLSGELRIRDAERFVSEVT